MWGVGSIRGACGGWGALGVHVGGGVHVRGWGACEGVGVGCIWEGSI